MIKYMHYSAAKGKITSGSDSSYAVPSGKDFAWIFMQNPSEPELKKVSKDFSIEQKYFKTYSKEHRSVRYSINPLVFVFMDYYLEHGRIKNSRVLFALKENALIVVMQHKNDFHSQLFDNITGTFDKSEEKSLLRLMYRFLMDDVDENYEVLERVETIIGELEKQVVSGKNGKVIYEIVKMKRAIYRMSRRFWGSAKIVFVIKKGLTPLKVDVEDIILLDDVYNTYMHQIDILSSAKEMLSDIMAVYDTRAQNELNLVIKKLTAITVILMVPTMIASIYGMNFTHMPELIWEYGYPLALGAMFLSILLLAAFFKKKKWF